MFLMKADLPFIRFHVLTRGKDATVNLNSNKMKSISLRKCEFHLRLLSLPTVRASFPDGWTDSDVTDPLRNTRGLSGLL